MYTSRLRFHIADILKFSAICCGILALFRWSGVDLSFGVDWPWSVLYPVGVAVCCALSIMRPKVSSPRCQICGKRYFRARKTDAEGVCPYCRVPRLPRDQRRRLAIQGFAIITILLLSLSFVLLWPFADFLRDRFGWFGYDLAVIGFFVFLVVVFAGSMVLRYLVRTWRMSRPGYALKVAQICARENAKERTFAAVSVYVFGPNDPTTMLKGEMQTCQGRFESLVGEPVEIERPLRVLVFGKRSAFETFFRWAFLYHGNVDGFYIPWATVTITITTEFPPCNLADPQRVARVLLTYFLLDSHRKRPSPPWLQLGIANLLACGSDREELSRLNRKMLAAISRGAQLGTADLFAVQPRAMASLMRDWQDHGKFAHSNQLSTQSWSLVEYLCGREAPIERQIQFRAFLVDRSSKEPREKIFERHFGFGFDSLLEGWRVWVQDRGIGVHQLPPDHIRDALRECVIPTIQDYRANPLERIQAIREMGRAGYALGADTLIDLLGNDAQIPDEEIIWSLESISGLALGNGTERWANWWDGLPHEAMSLCHQAKH
jgi:hypothetical protein